MRLSRLWRPAAACRTFVRFSLLFAIASTSTGSARAADGIVSGTVTDQSGQPLPRVFVRILDSSDHEVGATFADEGGRFRAQAPERCSIDASLTGFEPARVDCNGAAPLRVVLTVTPIQETVVVSATRTEAPAAQVGASVTTFTAADLERRNLPLAVDVLRFAPGAIAVRSGGAGTITALFVRGGESNYNKVLLDGIPLNEPGGAFNFSNLSTENLDRIEFVRGAHSALFGSDAVASVVQLVTRRPDRNNPRPHVAATLEGGTYGTVRGAGSVSGASGPLDYTIGAARFSTDNREPNNAFGNTSLSAQVGVALPHDAMLRAVGRGELERVGTPGQTAFGRPDLDAFFARHDGVGGVSYDQSLTARVRQRAAYSFAASNQQSTNLVLDPPYQPRFEDRVGVATFSDFPYDSRSKFRRHHASYQVDWRLFDGGAHGEHLLTALADWDGERATLENRLASTVTKPSRNNGGVAVQHQAFWPRTFVTVGGRIERNASFGTAAVPRGSIVFVARQAGGAFGETRVRASGGRGIKEPSMLESFSLSPFARGNPDLNPERSRSFEAALEQRFARDRARAEIVWFDNRFIDKVSTRTTNPATFEAQYFNLGLSRARGAELVLDAAPVRPLRVRGGYTFVASRVLESTAPGNVLLQVGNWLFRRPRHSGFAEVTWQRERVTLDLRGLFVGRSVDSDFSALQPPMLENPGYTTWDARATYRLTPHLAALFAVDNIGDADYMEVLGYRALRRAARVGLRFNF
jgi:vitamin B12 transporter